MHAQEDTTLDCTLPHLSQLVVQGFMVHGRGPTAFFPLRELRIEETIGTRKCLRLSDFVGVLQACVNLEVLNIRPKALDGISFDIREGTNPVAVFHRLRDLTIAGKVEDVSNLLSHMDLRRDAEIWLETEEQEVVEHAAVAVRNILPSDLSRSSLGILRSATRIQVYVPSPSFHEVLAITATCGMDLHHKLNLSVQVSEERREAADGTASRQAKAVYFCNALANLPTIFQNAPLETLVCRGQTKHVSVEAWQSICRSFPTLKTLVVDDSCHSGNVRHLINALMSPQSSRDTRPICPNLEYLWICNTSETVVAPNHLHHLRQCLMWRISQQVPLQRLRLHSLVRYHNGMPPDLSGYRREFARLVPNASLNVSNVHVPGPEDKLVMDRVDWEFNFDTPSR